MTMLFVLYFTVNKLSGCCIEIGILAALNKHKVRLTRNSEVFLSSICMKRDIISFGEQTFNLSISSSPCKWMLRNKFAKDQP